MTFNQGISDLRNIIVTGATGGVGTQVVTSLIEEKKYRVICLARKLGPELNDIIQSSDNRATFVKLDLNETDQFHPVIRSIAKEFGNIYGLVNNAAVGLDGVLATMHESDIESAIKVNLMATILLTKYCVRSMLLGNSGRVINVGSVTSITGFNGLSVYAATKAGVVGFSKSLSREVGASNITVNCVIPGFMETKMTSNLPRKKLDKIAKRSPLGLVTPSDIASTIQFLLAESGSKITGTCITVDGGSTA